MNRRRFLLLTSAGLWVGSAGCLGGGDSSDEPIDISAQTQDPSTPGTTSAVSTTTTKSPTSTPAPESKKPVSVKRGKDITHTFKPGIKIRGFGWTDQQLDYGTLSAVGVVENVSSERFAQASISVDFYDERTQISTNVSWHYFLGVSEYGELEVPYLGDNPDQVTRIQVSSGVHRDPLTPLNDGEVKVTEDGLAQNEGGRPIVTGTVQNKTDDRLSRVYPHVMFYNNKELLDSRKDGISRLGPDEKAEWKVLTDRADYAKVNRYEVVTLVSKD